MDNLRNDYRHVFGPDQRLEGYLECVGSPATYRGEIVDLSTAGMRIMLRDAVPPKDQEKLRATFVLPLPVGPITISSSVVYLQKIEEEDYCGIHFLSSGSAGTDLRRERTIWQCLTVEQRKILRTRRQGTGAAPPVTPHDPA